MDYGLDCEGGGGEEGGGGGEAIDGDGSGNHGGKWRRLKKVDERGEKKVK